MQETLTYVLKTAQGQLEIGVKHAKHAVRAAAEQQQLYCSPVCRLRSVEIVQFRMVKDVILVIAVQEEGRSYSITTLRTLEE